MVEGMSNNIEKVSTHELFPIIEELLACNKQAIFTISGYSMLPFMGSQRDQVLLGKRDFEGLKRGEIILFKLDCGKYILHRIYKVTDEGYLTMGDGNLHYDGIIRPEQVIGVVEKIYRKNKEIDCSSTWFKIMSNIWMALLSVRKYILKLYHFMHFCKKKVKVFFSNDKEVRS